MPVMPRPSSKATKIAFAIIGVPANMATKPTRKDKEIDKRTLWEDSVRIR